MLEGRGCSDADPEMVRGEGDRRGQLQRIVHGDLGRLLEGVPVGALVDIVVSDDIRDEDTVEDATLQSPSEILPVFQVLVSPRTVSRVGPEAGRLMADAIHGEGVEANGLAGHGSASQSVW